MPLIKSPSRAAVGQNIKEMRSSGYPRAQAIAASLHNARKYGAHFAAGGGMAGPSWTERASARALTHEGLINSAVPGRTDKLPISVAGGAYILPADHVSALGQGNTMAGANIVNKMFKMGPYGSSPSTPHGIKATTPRLNMNIKPGKFAKGGGHHGAPVPIIAAGGEVALPPDKIIDRFGDLDAGHRALDKWVVDTRKKHAKTLQKLKPPKAG